MLTLWCPPKKMYLCRVGEVSIQYVYYIYMPEYTTTYSGYGIFTPLHIVFLVCSFIHFAIFSSQVKFLHFFYFTIYSVFCNRRPQYMGVLSRFTALKYFNACMLTIHFLRFVLLFWFTCKLCWIFIQFLCKALRCVF